MNENERRLFATLLGLCRQARVIMSSVDDGRELVHTNHWANSLNAVEHLADDVLHSPKPSPGEERLEAAEQVITTAHSAQWHGPSYDKWEALRRERSS